MHVSSVSSFPSPSIFMVSPLFSVASFYFQLFYFDPVSSIKLSSSPLDFVSSFSFLFLIHLLVLLLLLQLSFLQSLVSISGVTVLNLNPLLELECYPNAEKQTWLGKVQKKKKKKRKSAHLRTCKNNLFKCQVIALALALE